MQASVGLRWLADRDSGAAQALGSITGSMGFESRDELVALLKQFEYERAFADAFPGAAGNNSALSAENYATALQSYQHTLRTPAPFDSWLNGDDGALDSRQLSGLEQFMSLGCAACHSGALLGGTSMQRFGIHADYRQLTGSGSEDQGLMDKTGKPVDRDVFRVQPLRNVAKTAPYFHDASVDTLEQAIQVMAEAQLGRSLQEADIEEMVLFLGALSGPVPGNYSAPSMSN
jgi:cytochrome c peroxidase